MPFDFSIEYKAGRENKGADALSKKPQYADFLTLAIPFPLDFAQLHEELAKDEFTARIIADLQKNPAAVQNFQQVQGMLYYDNRLVIPSSSPLKQTLLEEAHASLSGGHGGFLKTLKRLSSNFFWPRMKQDVKAYVQNCMTCQRNK